MPRRGRLNLKEQNTFFVTTSVKEHEKLFDDKIIKGRLRDIIFESIRRHKADLYGYVIMSNHFHLLLRLEAGGPGLSRFMQHIKSISARLLYPERKGIWQERFDDVAIYTEEQFRTKLNYIHNNPVKAGLVDRAEDYLFSSAKDWLEKTEKTIVKTNLD